MKLGRTIGAKDVAEDGSEVLVVRQLVDDFRQATGRHLEKEGQTFGEAGVDHELGQGDGTELQQRQEPNSPSDFLKTKRQKDEGYNKITAKRT